MMERCVKNYYASVQTHYSFLSGLSRTKLQKITEAIDKQSRTEVVKVGNPAKIFISSEDELLVCLGI